MNIRVEEPLSSPLDRTKVAGTIDESELIEGLRRGEDRFYAILVKAQSGPMLAVARRFLDEDDARDAVQEAFTKLFESLNNFRGDARLSTWLHRVVVNCCLNKLRKPHMKMEVSDDLPGPEFFSGGHRMNSSPPWPDHVLEQAQLKQRISEAIQRLPDSFKTIVVLRDMEGFSVAETATFLAISESLVKTRLHRARQALREQLDPYIQREFYGH